MAASDLAFLSAAQSAALVRERRVSPVELVQAYLERVERLNPRLNAYVTVCADEALAQAKEAEGRLVSSGPAGPLFGVPIAIKDQFDTKGLRTSRGSRLFQDRVPEQDATVVRRLREAGTILLGKLNLAELALGGTREPPGGIPRNPWDLDRIPGDSSSGSGIAVAAHLCAASLGEDTAGSGRTPAAYCGIVGLRPTYGRISRHGASSMCWHMDVAAPMTKTVEDCALMLGALAGHDAQDPFSSRREAPDYTAALGGTVRGVRVGVIRELDQDDILDPEVRALLSQATETLRHLGAEVREVSVPMAPMGGAIFVGIGDTEAASVWDEALRTRPELLDSATRTRLQAAALLPASLYQRALKARRVLREQMLSALREVDVLVSATSCFQPPLYGQDAAIFANSEDVRRRMHGRRSYVTGYPLAALPAISVPCGFTSSNLPAGMQLGGRAFEEATLLRVAHAYEQATPWHTRRPPIAEE